MQVFEELRVCPSTVSVGNIFPYFDAEGKSQKMWKKSSVIFAK